MSTNADTPGLLAEFQAPFPDNPHKPGRKGPDETVQAHVPAIPARSARQSLVGHTLRIDGIGT
ncbi:MAG: hypothetical protein KDJ89_05190, partial [Notoacmeibacter sp.]|nr:hypothetical protein [Notoacmeibacter sp.]